MILSRLYLLDPIILLSYHTHVKSNWHWCRKSRRHYPATWYSSCVIMTQIRYLSVSTCHLEGVCPSILPSPQPRSISSTPKRCLPLAMPSICDMAKRARISHHITRRYSQHSHFAHLMPSIYNRTTFRTCSCGTLASAAQTRSHPIRAQQN